MLRVRTIYAHSAGAAVDYYTRYLTEAPGEIPGRWHGQQAVGIGLAGDVVADDLLAILNAARVVAIRKPLADYHEYALPEPAPTLQPA